jgi:hypothetical protein
MKPILFVICTEKVKKKKILNLPKTRPHIYAMQHYENKHVSDYFQWHHSNNICKV